MRLLFQLYLSPVCAYLGMNALKLMRLFSINIFHEFLIKQGSLFRLETLTEHRYLSLVALNIVLVYSECNADLCLHNCTTDLAIISVLDTGINTV